MKFPARNLRASAAITYGRSSTSPTIDPTSSAKKIYRWYVVAICMVAYVFSYIDRQIMTLLIEPIQTDLALSDTQFGLLHGLAFALFYATMGIPIAQLSDRHSRPLIIAIGVFLWSIYQLLAWGPAILIRAYGLTAAQSGYALGMATLVASTTGVLASGWLNDRLRQRGRLDAPMRTGAIGGAGVVVPVVLLPFATSLPLAITLFGIALFFAAFPMPPSTAAIQLLAPNRMRSRIAAMFLFCNSLFGMAIGAALVGALNDYVFESPAAVTVSVAIVVGCAGVGTAAVLAAGMRPFSKSLGRHPIGGVDS